MSPRSATAAVVVLVAVLAGCGLRGGGPVQEASPSSTIPPVTASAGEWAAMSAAPLEPRGGALPVWTGERLLLLGGYRYDEQQPPCPPAASCAAPQPTRFDDGAAWDPATGTWAHLVGPAGATSGSSQVGDRAVWSGESVFTRSQRTTPDLARGTLTRAAVDSGPALVYSDPVWTGDRLVTVGWDYGAAASGVDGQLVAQVLDPSTGGATAVPWPYGPPGAEGVRTAWTGREVVALVATHGASETSEGTWRVVAFGPAASTWRSVTDRADQPWDAAWDGQRVLVETPDRLTALDVATGGTSEVAPLPDHRLGDLQVSASGRLLLTGSPSYLLDEDDDGDARWLRVPEPPRAAVTTDSTVAWAGDDLVVWGGTQASEQDGGATRSTAEGWVWRGLGARVTAG
ncbi:hypothetical protein ACUN7V_01495 [Quadrisphaera oryzae]|uniref:hypothetical protein n=1 Tax=Quadrisphaera TaxID=317661 RepID=UPI0016460D8F|nr:hypothetical protein [Quadrisphaera sp. RL12-1S]MBC3762703.1 hypothetical protein [Quadrisphaera sp. RL12-1S]